MSPPSIIVIGASGRLGLEIIRAAARAPERPLVHAFCRTPAKIPPEDVERCASIVQGDARLSEDIERALVETRAEVAVLSIGVPNSPAKTDLREMSAKALVDVIRPGGVFDAVRVLDVSSMGAGGTKIEICMGLGMLYTHVIRHVLADHNNREKLLTECFWADDEHKKRLLILRPTLLTLGTPKGGVVLFGDKRSPNPWIDREDLAKWIVDEICTGCPSFGKAVHITGK